MRSSTHAARSSLLLVSCACFALVFIQLLGNARAEQPAPSPKPDTSDKAAASAPGDAAAKSPGDPKTPANTSAPADTSAPATDGTTPAPAAGAADVAPEDIPVNLRLRRLEQRVQALKERAWRAKARVGMLKEAVLGGGVGASASIVHKNKMGRSFRLLKLVYALDGTQIFARSDDTGELHNKKSIDILTGPIAPGSHTISVYALYRGNGYGVFKYLNKYRFKVRSSHTFTATEGKSTKIEVSGFEKGGITTPLEKRPAIDFKVTQTKGMLK